jgi:hypothetical protein
MNNISKILGLLILATPNSNIRTIVLTKEICILTSLSA